MKRVLQRIWSIWFYILFLLVFGLIFPLHFILLRFKSKWAHNMSHRLNMFWGWMIMYPVGVWLKNENRRKISRKGTYIFAPNHTSYLDIPICNVSIHTSFRFIGKAELNRLPLFGYMFKRLHISVNRSSVTDSYRSFVRAKEKLQEGTSILIFPEATIPDKKKVTLLKFKDGAFRLAIENQVPIVPMTILGADRVFPDDNTLLLYPGRIRVIYHDPIDTKGMEVSDAPALKNRVRDLMLETIVENGYALPDAQVTS